MAKFEMTMPTEVFNDLKHIYDNADYIFGGMTKAGAEVVYKNIQTNIPPSWHDSDIMHCLKITDVYKTPSDGGINTKVAFYGYFENKQGQTVPAPLVVNVTEYGRSTSEYPKRPFMRKSFRKKEIEQAMLSAQKKLSGGILDGGDSWSDIEADYIRDLQR